MPAGESSRMTGADAGSGRVECRVDGPVAGWLVDNPPVNALTRSMFEALVRACDETRRDARVRAVVVMGAGERCFSAGADLRELLRMDVTQAMARAELVYAFFDKLAELPVPTICACNGSAVGGGFEVALMCDVIIASEDAKFGLPEIRSGVVPASVGLRRLAEAIGYPRARALVYTGELISAAEARSLGLVHRVVSAGEVVPAANDLARQMALQSQTALRAAKELFTASLSSSPSELRELGLKTFAQLLKSQGLRDAIQAFVERRGR